MKSLKDIATIRVGVPFRHKVNPAKQDGYPLIQISDIHKDAGIRTDSVQCVEAPEVRESHILHKGDVLLIGRGTRNHAATFTADLPKAIVGSQVFIIRLDSTKVLPEFLAWYLNQEGAQKYIAEFLSGSFVRFLPRDALDSLPVVLPPLEVQRKIVAVHKLWLEEQRLIQDIQKKRAQLIEGALQKMIN